MPLQKEDLLEDHYTWSTADHNGFEGQPSRRLFDRYNGDQVLFLINFYGSMSDKFSLEEGRKMEKLIASALPMDARSEISVYNWLKQSS